MVMHTNHPRNYDSFQQRTESNSTGRVLTATTGNAQAFPERSKAEHAASHYPEPSIISGPVVESRAPRIARKSSHASRNLDRRNIVFKRLRQRLKLCQQYQDHPEYKRYRERERKDVNKHNKKIIWTDEMEEAFSNALVNIPPMGRRKKSQRGRAFGRNELISEWILRETGEERTRKQISSHIQVFDKIFIKFPEWRHLSRGLSEQSVIDLDTDEYYNNSVEDMVRHWPDLRKLLLESLVTSPGMLTASPLIEIEDSFGDRHQLEKFEFEMWIGPSANVDKHLHDFTKLSKSGPSSEQIRLEEVENWRCDYPDLEFDLQEFDSTGHCEIVMVNSSFHMMDDFPTDSLKLGINFLMEFSNPHCAGTHRQGCMESFTCVTRMYQDGKYLRQTDENACQMVGPGRVKPPFESKWWAREFVRLTERCGIAKDSGSVASMATATDMCQRFFQGLTMMQRIFAGPSADTASETGLNRFKHRQKAVILLWKFEQAPPDADPCTQWHKLIPPPPRETTNSPLSALEANVPPSNLDTILSLINRRPCEFDQKSQFGEMRENGRWYSSDDEEELCQDGFMFSSLHNGTIYHLEPHPSFEHDVEASHESYIANGFHHYPPSIVPTQLGSFTDGAYHDDATANMFGTHGLDHQPIAPSQLSMMDSRRYLNGGSPARSRFPYRRQPFNNFDTNTHIMLQTQIHMDENGSDATRIGQSEEGSYAGSQQALNQPAMPSARNTVDANLMTNESEMQICERGFKEEGMNHKGEIHVYQDLDIQHPPHFAAPVPIRPQLQQFHSFACILSTEDTSFDTAKPSYARMAEHIGDDMSEAFAEQNFPTIDSVVRAHSQPPPSIRAGIDTSFE